MRRLCDEHEPPVTFRLVYVPGRGEAMRDLAAGPSALSAVLREACAGAGVAFHDLTPAFQRAWSAHPGRTSSGMPYYFPADMHWTAAGHALAAEELLKAWAW